MREREREADSKGNRQKKEKRKTEGKTICIYSHRLKSIVHFSWGSWLLGTFQQFVLTIVDQIFFFFSYNNGINHQSADMARH